MSLHYNIEETLAEMRQRLQTVVVEQNSPKEVIIIERNREVTMALMKMMLSEINQGTQYDDIIFAAASFSSEFLFNFVHPMPPMAQAHFIKRFFDHFSNCLNQSMDGSAATTSVSVSSQPGGHA